ncbi:hydrolase [Lysobacter concretionis Ko07 = DSM 16239]|uniref:Hydrolase n=1 Tax=Lysobacter concretionis Ko07 = DSM 16239 TaxID=1122185 RepID=A0A0A0ETA3_9GAMM|nr:MULTISPECIES: HAD family hydrolase [Lysobacter]KGM52342.1 hydrolase [Lysobacter concretionis Ko07 = DSM 16239]QOD91921.1 HAD-IB family hydrolase [Lysobacter sp. CW239]
MSLALFDFDGTITTHETMPEFLCRSISRRRLFMGWLLLAPLMLGYKWQLIAGTLVRRAIVRVGYSGVAASAVVTSGRDFAESYLPNVLRPEAMQRIAWHVVQGHKVVVVSGGLDVYLAPWCEAHGLELLCSSLQRRNGVLTGYYEGQQCVLAEKARRVRERYDLQAFTEVYAYGDTFEDRDLLGIATRKYYQWQEVGAAGGR